MCNTAISIIRYLELSWFRNLENQLHSYFGTSVKWYLVGGDPDNYCESKHVSYSALDCRLLPCIVANCSVVYVNQCAALAAPWCQLTVWCVDQEHYRQSALQTLQTSLQTECTSDRVHYRQSALQTECTTGRVQYRKTSQHTSLQTSLRTDFTSDFTTDFRQSALQTECTSEWTTDRVHYRHSTLQT